MHLAETQNKQLMSLVNRWMSHYQAQQCWDRQSQWNHTPQLRTELRFQRAAADCGATSAMDLVSVHSYCTSWPMSCWLAHMRSRPVTFLWLWPATDHDPHCHRCPLTKFKCGLNLLHKADDDMAGIYSDCSTREVSNCVIRWASQSEPLWAVVTGTVVPTCISSTLEWQSRPQEVII